MHWLAKPHILDRLDVIILLDLGRGATTYLGGSTLWRYAVAWG